MSTSTSSAIPSPEEEFSEQRIKQLKEEMDCRVAESLKKMSKTKFSDLPRHVLYNLCLEPTALELESGTQATQAKRAVSESESLIWNNAILRRLLACCKQPVVDLTQTKKAAGDASYAQKKEPKQTPIPKKKNNAKGKNPPPISTAQNVSSENLKLKKTNTRQEQKQGKNGKEKTAPSCSTTQKVSANCEKCARTSKRCNDVTSNLKTAENEIKNLKKKLAVYEGPEHQQNERKSYFELEKELAEVKKRNEEMEDENEKFATKVKEMEREFERQHLEISELTALTAEKDNAIRYLKANVPSDALKRIAETQRLSLEMRRIFWDLREKLDNLFLEDPLTKAEKIVTSLKQKCNDPQIGDRADYEFLVFRQSILLYQTAVEQEVKKIQADPFITQLELVKLPELPMLSDWLRKGLETAQAEFNKKIDDECVVCYRDEGADWFYCSGCLKRTHVKCARKWWRHQQKNSQQESCPHCKKVLENVI